MPSRSRFRRAAAALLLGAAATHAASADISLHEAVRIATERAPTLEARHADAESARQQARRADALPDPMLMVGIDNLPVTGGDAFDFGAADMTMQRIGLRQEIPAGAKRRAQRTLAERDTERAQALVVAERTAVRQAAAAAWIGLWTRQRELAALRRLHEQAALAARLARARLEGGGAADDALAAEAAVLELDIRIQAAQAAQTEAAAELRRWLGDGEFRASAQAPDFTALPFSEAALLAALDRLPALLPAAAQVETAAAAIDLARAGRRPDWSVAAAYGRREGARSDMVMLEVGIGLPLFPRNRQDRDVAAHEAAYRAALAERENRRREQAAHIRAGFARWEGLRRQVALHERSLLPLLRDRSDAALAGYRAGGALQAWLQAQRDELDAHLAHARHLGELGRAWARLAYLTEESQS